MIDGGLQLGDDLFDLRPLRRIRLLEQEDAVAAQRLGFFAELTLTLRDVVEVGRIFVVEVRLLERGERAPEVAEIELTRAFAIGLARGVAIVGDGDAAPRGGRRGTARGEALATT